VRDRAFEVVRSRLAEARHRVERLASAAAAGALGLAQACGRRLNVLSQRLAVLDPRARLIRRRARLQELAGRMEQSARLGLQRGRERFGTAAARLNALSPLASLGRGYSICRRPDGAVVSRVAQVGAGDWVEVRVSDGRLDCEVRQTEEGR